MKEQVEDRAKDPWAGAAEYLPVLSPADFGDYSTTKRAAYLPCVVSFDIFCLFLETYCWHSFSLIFPYKYRYSAARL